MSCSLVLSSFILIPLKWCVHIATLVRDLSNIFIAGRGESNSILNCKPVPWFFSNRIVNAAENEVKILEGNGIEVPIN